jgi:hypothetical protein
MGCQEGTGPSAARASTTVDRTAHLVVVDRDRESQFPDGEQGSEAILERRAQWSEPRWAHNSCAQFARANAALDRPRTERQSIARGALIALPSDGARTRGVTRRHREWQFRNLLSRCDATRRCVAYTAVRDPGVGCAAVTVPGVVCAAVTVPGVACPARASWRELVSRGPFAPACGALACARLAGWGRPRLGSRPSHPPVGRALDRSRGRHDGTLVIGLVARPTLARERECSLE